MKLTHAGLRKNIPNDTELTSATNECSRKVFSATPCSICNPPIVQHWHLVKRDVVVVVTRLLPRDGGMAEDHGAPEAGQLSKAWTRGRREIESRERASAAQSPYRDCSAVPVLQAQTGASI